MAASKKDKETNITPKKKDKEKEESQSVQDTHGNTPSSPKKGTEKSTGKKSSSSSKKSESSSKKKSKKSAKASSGTSTSKKKSSSKKNVASSKKSTSKKSSSAGKKSTSAKKAPSSSGSPRKESTTRTKKKDESSYPLVPAKKKTPSKSKKEIAMADSDDDVIDPESLSRGDVPMGVIDHLDEFRSRLLIILGTIIIFTVAGFFFSDYLLMVLTKPFDTTGHKLNIFKLTGGFLIRLKASFVSGLLLGIPVIVFQIWRFISPAIGKDARKFSRNLLLLAPLLFYGGIAFVFFGVLPFAIDMLLKFIGKEMLSTIGANDYLSFVMVFGIAMGLLFELPIIATILTRAGIISPQFLVQKRKVAVIAIWIVAALITPQDLFSQILVAVPLMFLYEISILISRVVFRNRMKKLAREEEELRNS